MNNGRQQDRYSSGIAIFAGTIWHRQDKKGLYLVALDADTATGIKELCTRNGQTISLQKMSEKFIVEQHEDDPDRAHILFYSPVPFPQKVADSKIGLEVKSEGKHGILFCSPSIHRNGYPYKIIGTREPTTLTRLQAYEFVQHINQICIKHGLEYLGKHSKITGKIKQMLKGLAIDKTISIPKGERHITLISIADSLLIRHLGRSNNTERTLKEYL